MDLSACAGDGDSFGSACGNGEDKSGGDITVAVVSNIVRMSLQGTTDVPSGNVQANNVRDVDNDASIPPLWLMEIIIELATMQKESLCNSKVSYR